MKFRFILVFLIALMSNSLSQAKPSLTPLWSSSNQINKTLSYQFGIDLRDILIISRIDFNGFMIKATSDDELCQVLTGKRQSKAMNLSYLPSDDRSLNSLHQSRLRSGHRDGFVILVSAERLRDIDYFNLSKPRWQKLAQRDIDGQTFYLYQGNVYSSYPAEREAGNSLEVAIYSEMRCSYLN